MSDKKPNGFFIHADRFAAISSMLTMAEIGRLITAVCAYFESGELPKGRSRAFEACFTLLREDIDRDVKRYQEVCSRNREMANRRWHPPADTPQASGGEASILPASREAESSSDACACQGMPAHAYTTQPNTTQPNTTQSNTTQPNTTQPSATQAGAAKPGAAKPGAPQASAARVRSPQGGAGAGRTASLPLRDAKGERHEPAKRDPRFARCTPL